MNHKSIMLSMIFIIHGLIAEQPDKNFICKKIPILQASVTAITGLTDYSLKQSMYDFLLPTAAGIVCHNLLLATAQWYYQQSFNHLAFTTQCASIIAAHLLLPASKGIDLRHKLYKGACCSTIIGICSLLIQQCKTWHKNICKAIDDTYYYAYLQARDAYLEQNKLGASPLNPITQAFSPNNYVIDATTFDTFVEEIISIMVLQQYNNELEVHVALQFLYNNNRGLYNQMLNTFSAQNCDKIMLAKHFYNELLTILTNPALMNHLKNI